MNNKININWYPGHMAKTKRLISENISYIDVVYEVLDARIPYSSKIKDIDQYIKDKPRIIVMTKIDLCDMVETNKWIKYYEKMGYKVIGLDLENNPNLKSLINLTDELMKESNLRREAKGMLKRKTRVLIVGIPNVGKSTLINRLVEKKATKVGNMPGVTKSLDWIRINEELELLDSPGILWPKLDETKVAFNLASLTAIKEEVLPIYDVVEYIIRTLFNLYPDILKERYGLEKVSDDIIETLDFIGKKRGCLIKGGEIDYDKVISIILNEIKDGTIKKITFDRVEDYEK
ncbi:MAG: ribosome biogenesis GTPase YlqF [Bacilli bacterium]|nr:ribosome biogenesis GTPase YlqF [Bacilli bacterium]MDD4808854.1 ribosome biogenesis GTPase YlqF [Bacilli bacterium]